MASSPWYRLALSILLLGMVLWLWSTRFDELAYHTWQSHELIDLGDATAFSEQQDNIPPNSYVRVSGILGNKAATLKGLRAGSLRFGPYQIRHLLGSKLYIEYDEEKYHKNWSPFTRVEVSGRLVSLGPNSELTKVRDFFARYYNRPIADNAMLIVVDETPKSQWRYPLLFGISLIIVLTSFYFAVLGIRRGRVA